jgi:hypothetical protein
MRRKFFDELFEEVKEFGSIIFVLALLYFSLKTLYIWSYSVGGAFGVFCANYLLSCIFLLYCFFKQVVTYAQAYLFVGMIFILIVYIQMMGHEKTLSLMNVLFFSPVLEEVVYRGLVSSFLANIVKIHWKRYYYSAFLFAVLHGEVTQGYDYTLSFWIGAFLLGCLNEFLLGKYKMLSICIGIHVASNVFALYFAKEIYMYLNKFYLI